MTTADHGGAFDRASGWTRGTASRLLLTTARQMIQGAQRKRGIGKFRVNAAVPFSAPQAIDPGKPVVLIWPVPGPELPRALRMGFTATPSVSVQ